ncbi:soluble aldose sugar dehydrogenase [Microlunatus phosphovorus NM-1]|uniref:Soluble aldose sugar dehydrogenase n=1 Tax=Microlunatus phosphovorus (strain ATCC 700054 / DSM 10555 / JCM 9379 / NBRC 101784 / NCIMB 13414 / VKM Ac-1990 / NM-1) TaxID=1032480 RepID=F5XST2_MICPN|nr:PQQ-dependent sugar dehydrogenase [Microlunatus phosphovorus]BAK37340.1 soluble aldose sugar dehydrogenase [Microlunatus phosphovorus NM-1]
MMRRVGIVAIALGLLAGCTAAPEGERSVGPAAESTSAATAAPNGRPFVIEEIAELDEPWAMTFLPDGRALISGRGGDLTLRTTDGQLLEVDGVPDVVHAGQGGFGDVIAAPDFASTSTVYVSWAEAGEGGSGAAVGRAKLTADGGSPALSDLTVIWRQQPKVSGSGHYGHRLAFSPDGAYLFVSSGERQKFDPAQDLGANLGKILRLTPEGQPADGNPFADRGGVAAEIWTYGHRNPLGIAFDADGNLWNSEMGPQGGDELNLVRAGANYGWPKASNGSHYGGADIPDHADGDGFEAPKVWWNPSVSPGSLMIYRGAMFPQWQGDAFLGALSGQALIRVNLDGTDAIKGDEWNLGRRVREVEQAPDGSIWLLTDEGQVLRLRAP